MTDLNGPPRSAPDLQRLAALRRRAVARLPGVPAADAATAAADALVVLHTMASSPETAASALALLHELQVHQVELDLQAQDLRDDRAELETALRRQDERYDHLPVGCVELDAEFVVRGLNRRAATMIGLDPAHAVGLPLAGLVAGDSLQRLHAATAGIEGGRAVAGCRLVLRAPPGAGRAVAAQVAADPVARGYLLVMAADAADEAPTERR